ncbi:MAG: hypothetical protein QXE15_00055 [Candidatus Bathyarchaeia archaeon]
MKKEEIISKILLCKPGLTKEELEKLIEEKKRAYSGLLSDEGAARLIAQELLIDLTGKLKPIEVKIKDLVTGLNDVTLTARVIIDWPIQDFIKSNGEKNVVKKLLLADETGIVQCLVWGEKALTLQKNGKLQDKIVKIFHAYTRKGLNTNVELHLGVKSSIIVSPPDVHEEKFPKLTKFINRISELRNLNKANIIGTVKSQPKTSTFKCEFGVGKVSRVKLFDFTGEVTLVAWNEQAEKITNVKIGDTIQVMNGKVIVGVGDSIEIHTEKQTVLTIIAKETNEILKISNLKSGIKNCNITVKVFKKSELKTVKVAGKETLIVEALVGDETGLTIITFWGENARLIANIKENDVITIVNAAVKVDGKFIALTAGKLSAINLETNIILVDPPKTKINEIMNGNKLLIVEGVVVDVSPVKEVIVKGETIKVSSLTLKDEEEQAKITFWREAADEASKIKVGENIKVLGVFLKERKDKQVELSSIRLTKILRKNRY